MKRLPGLGARAGLAQHPLAERNDEPGILGDRDELGRRHQAGIGLRPANQRLGADDARRGKVHLRLIVQRELAALEGAPQIGLGCQPAAHALGHLRAEELEVGASSLLGVVHRGVGGAYQRLGSVAVARIEGDPDTGVGVQLVSGDRERLCEVGEDPRRDNRRFGGTGDVGEADDELVTAETSDGVQFAP